MRHSNHPLDHDTQCLEAIALLKFHRTQDFNYAKRYYVRVNRVAVRAAILAFIIMSYFLHSTLLGGNADTTTHALAFMLNCVIAILTFIMIREFHPSRIVSGKYLQSSKEHKRQIMILEDEMKKSETNRTDGICCQKRKNSVAAALANANNIIHQ